jgi:FeS assembly protein IscX
LAFSNWRLEPDTENEHCTLNTSPEILTWDDSYAIAQALRERFPSINLEGVSLNMVYRWTIELPGFDDDPQLANDSVLAAIYQEWYEEVILNEP